MNRTHLVDALLHDVPVVMCPGRLGEFESVLTQRGRMALDSRLEQRRLPPKDDRSLLYASVAKSPEQLAAARDLVRERYSWRGYNVGEPTAASPVARQQRSAQEITFLVASERALVGTLTMGLDGPFGLRAESAYGDVIEQFRSAGRRLCELTSLALAKGLDSKPVLASLFSLAHAVGRTLHDLTDVLIEVNPRHVDFYSRVLGFAVAAGEKFCERVAAPSVLLRLELEALETRLASLDFEAPMHPLAQAA